MQTLVEAVEDLRLSDRERNQAIQQMFLEVSSLTSTLARLTEGGREVYPRVGYDLLSKLSQN
jgi:hypothetical protein